MKKTSNTTQQHNNNITTTTTQQHDNTTTGQQHDYSRETGQHNNDSTTTKQQYQHYMITLANGEFRERSDTADSEGQAICPHPDSWLKYASSSTRAKRLAGSLDRSCQACSLRSLRSGWASPGAT